MNKDIQRLIQLFLDGKTTLEEEARLAEYFRNNDVPEEWQPYKEMFQWFDNGMPEDILQENDTVSKTEEDKQQSTDDTPAMPPEESDSKTTKIKTLRRAAIALAGIAAAVLLVWAISTRDGNDFQQDKNPIALNDDNSKAESQGDEVNHTAKENVENGYKENQTANENIENGNKENQTTNEVETAKEGEENKDINAATNEVKPKTIDSNTSKKPRRKRFRKNLYSIPAPKELIAEQKNKEQRKMTKEEIEQKIAIILEQDKEEQQYISSVIDSMVLQTDRDFRTALEELEDEEEEYTEY